MVINLLDLLVLFNFGVSLRILVFLNFGVVLRPLLLFFNFLMWLVRIFTYLLILVQVVVLLLLVPRALVLAAINWLLDLCTFVACIIRSPLKLLALSFLCTTLISQRLPNSKAVLF